MTKFAQKVRSFEVEDDGQSETFWMKKPRGGEMLRRLDVDETKKGKATEDMLKAALCQQDGSPLTTEQFVDILAMESSAFVKLTAKIGELIAPAEPKKDGEAKNV